MDEDFGTPEAVAVLFELAAEVNRSKSPEVAGLLKALGACLGLLQAEPQKFLQAGAEGVDAAAIEAQIAARAAAKAPRTGPRPTASARSCSSRASSSRTLPRARPGKRPPRAEAACNIPSTV
jgi:cysteinyl-tRNA synthetase